MLKYKNKTKYFFAYLFLFTSFSFSQEIETNDKEFKIEIIKVKKLKKIQISTTTILDSDYLKTIFIKLKMTSIDNTKKEFDVNKFILLDTTNKLKIRALDVSYQKFTAYVGFSILTKKPHTFNEKHSILTYNTSIPDSFEKYNFEGFSTIETPINFGTRRKPEPHVIYYEPEKYKSKKLIFHFPFPKEINQGVLYYGNQKIADLKFK
jgi:hypothetical protein